MTTEPRWPEGWTEVERPPSLHRRFEFSAYPETRAFLDRLAGPNPPTIICVDPRRTPVAEHARAHVATHGLTLQEFGIMEALHHKGDLLLGELQDRGEPQAPVEVNMEICLRYRLEKLPRNFHRLPLSWPLFSGHATFAVHQICSPTSGQSRKFT